LLYVNLIYVLQTAWLDVCLNQVPNDSNEYSRYSIKYYLNKQKCHLVAYYHSVSMYMNSVWCQTEFKCTCTLWICIIPYTIFNPKYPGWCFKFIASFIKKKYYLNGKKYIYLINGILWKIKRDAACINFLFAYVHKMNSRGVPANTHGLKITCMWMPLFVQPTDWISMWVLPICMTPHTAY
jgi:hypothetical protein